MALIRILPRSDLITTNLLAVIHWLQTSLRKIEKIPLEKSNDKKKNLETFKPVKKLKKKETVTALAKEKREEAEVEVIQCKICRLGVQLTCPVCKEAMVLCERYKNPSLRRLDSPVCEMFEERY